MTDTNTTDEQTEPTFGIDATEIEAEFNRAVEEADEVYHTIGEASQNTLRTARDAVSTLLIDAGHAAAADHINGLLRALSYDHINKRTAAAAQARERLIEAAKAKRDEALSHDPFAKRVVTVIKRQYGDEYSRDLLTNAPFTFESLRQLAVNRGWCTDYERAMQEFVRAGALPDESRVVTRNLHYSEVPREKDAKPDETWVANMTLPSYVRDTHHHGAYDYTDLHPYATSIEYERTAETPQADES